jgi:hypothetical protein
LPKRDAAIAIQKRMKKFAEIRKNQSKVEVTQVFIPRNSSAASAGYRRVVVTNAMTDSAEMANTGLWMSRPRTSILSSPSS